MAYADFTFYAETYKGAMPAADFERLAEQAGDYIDYITLNRAKTYAGGDTVSRACCAVADALLLNERGGGIASESNDGVSISYVAGVTNTKTNDQRLYDAARRTLVWTGLLYRGCGNA